MLGRQVPSPCPADFCFLLFAPPAIIGLLVLARRPVTRAGWVCLGLDSWLIGGSLLTLSWSLALAHTAHFSGETVAHAALSLAYPLLDIVLVSMVLALHFKRSSANRSAINTAIAALALTVLCDALFTSPLLRANYRSGQILDAGWFAGYMLMAYAPWVAREEGEEAPVRRGRTAVQHAGRPIAGSLAALTPYLAAAVCTLGILYNVLDGHHVDRVVLFTGCTVVLALVIRQGIMLLDNISLTQELAQKENHFRSLVQGSSDVIMIAAPTGILRYVSPAATGVYGRDAEELIGSELASLIHPEDLGRVVHEVRRFLAAPPAEEPTTRIECRFRSGTGDWLNVESTVNRHHGGLIFNSRDVTERVRLQAQLQHTAEHDPLTDLPNRALFTKRVQQALARPQSDRRRDGRALHRPRRLQGRQRQRGPPGGRRAAGTGRPPAPGLGPRGGFHGPLRRGRVRRAHHRRRHPRRRRARIPHPGDRRPAAAHPLPALPGRGRHRGARRRQHRRRLRRARHHPRRPHAQRRPRHVPRQAGRKGPRGAVRPQMQADVVRRAELATRLRTALHEGEFALLHQPVVELATGRITAVCAQARWRSAQGILFTPPTSSCAWPKWSGATNPSAPPSSAAGRWSGPPSRPPSAAARATPCPSTSGCPPPGCSTSRCRPRASRRSSSATACPPARSCWSSPAAIRASRSTSWSGGWSPCAASGCGWRSTASAADTRRWLHCAGSRSTSSSSTASSSTE
ncbi:hypothetical protein GCM10020000_23880 [Streptomyces olivoverticillatus]